ncbi:zinc metalloproteinase nas-6-like isoform X2 [Dermacentor andersoni]|uniref:zinc metalloproteinase nas-6-like isoform X2 n=1 Tax=Dermacentor andersoni TaxID=34620 RepID=UPI0024170EBF|nr:zinc metalloproteinase nas-6-like isoform X2 [Dermacentor andersoni]
MLRSSTPEINLLFEVMGTHGTIESVQRTATYSLRILWPGGVIPYIIDATLGTPQNVKIIKNAMDHIEKETCLRFVKRTNQADYVRLVSKEGCYSYLGRTGGQQPLSLGRGCLYHGTVTHELMHAVGFFHEHTNPERDRYIEVFPKNIIKGTHIIQRKKAAARTASPQYSTWCRVAHSKE